MAYTLTEEQFETLMERTRLLEQMVRDLAMLSKAMMDACEEDNPYLRDLPQFIEGRATLADIAKFMQ